MRITADDIARVTATPQRTVRDRLSKWHKRWHDANGVETRGCPVERITRSGVGGVQWSVDLDAYCARVGLDRNDVLEALGVLLPKAA